MNKSGLISFISKHSDRYGDLLLKLMDRYRLTNLQEATEEQLQEFIEQEVKK